MKFPVTIGTQDNAFLDFFENSVLCGKSSGLTKSECLFAWINMVKIHAGRMILAALRTLSIFAKIAEPGKHLQPVLSHSFAMNLSVCRIPHVFHVFGMVFFSLFWIFDRHEAIMCGFDVTSRLKPATTTLT
jgi:hypothetical protein